MVPRTIPQAENLQDSLRTVRSFVSNIGGSLVDQTLALTDASVRNSPYQYQSIGPTGVAVEGRPTAVIQGQPPVINGISNSTLLLVLAVAVAVLVIQK